MRDKAKGTTPNFRVEVRVEWNSRCLFLLVIILQRI
jgi:hypothetical protein